MTSPVDPSCLHRFSVDAMNTTFTLRINHPDRGAAQDAASACMNQLEQLEAELSRFRPDSDVSRINRLAEGESVYISEAVHACLLKAMEAQALTAGLFNATLGAHTWAGRSGNPGGEADDAGQLEIVPGRPLVICRKPGRQIDLGGIGKGFALDQLAATLASWRIRSSLLCAGASTMLAVGARSWPVEMTGETSRVAVELKNRAMGASGTGVQQAHVLHPDSPDQPPQYEFRRAWVLAPDAALADACSTAVLLMSAEEADAFAESGRGRLDVYTEDEDGSEIRLRTGASRLDT